MCNVIVFGGVGHGNYIDRTTLYEMSFYGRLLPENKDLINKICTSFAREMHTSVCSRVSIWPCIIYVAPQADLVLSFSSVHNDDNIIVFI